MGNLNQTLAGLELAQICWVVPDIQAAVGFFGSTLGVAGFPEPESLNAQELGMTYFGRIEAGEWLTTQTYSGSSFIEIVQPTSGKSMFHDYLAEYPKGGTQHTAFRLPVSGFDQLVSDLSRQGYTLISEVDHPIARMAFFDTYQTLGVATEIMGITPKGWSVIEQMKNEI